jgi:hypothetical protein
MPKKSKYHVKLTRKDGTGTFYGYSETKAEATARAKRCRTTGDYKSVKVLKKE